MTETSPGTTPFGSGWASTQRCSWKRAKPTQLGPITRALAPAHHLGQARLELAALGQPGLAEAVRDDADLAAAEGDQLAALLDRAGRPDDQDRDVRDLRQRLHARVAGMPEDLLAAGVDEVDRMRVAEAARRPQEPVGPDRAVGRADDR